MKFAFTDSRHIDGTVNKPANIFAPTLASKSEKKKKNTHPRNIEDVLLVHA